MRWSPQATKAVQQCIDSYVFDEDSKFRDTALHHKALPIYNGFGGLSMLLPDGNVLTVSHDAQDDVFMEDDEFSTFIRCIAAHKFSELRELVPARPKDAKNCLLCHGSGQNNDGERICNVCCGHGWDVISNIAFEEDAMQRRSTLP